MTDQPDLIDRRPRQFEARTSEEFFALCVRAKAGEFAWESITRGITTGDGRKAKTAPGWTWRVYYPVT